MSFLSKLIPMPRQYIRNGAYIFVFLVNDKVINPYSNLKAAYLHFVDIVQPGYTKHLSYSQLARKFRSTDQYNFMSSDRIKYTIQFYVSSSRYKPFNPNDHEKNNTQGSSAKT